MLAFLWPLICSLRGPRCWLAVLVALPWCIALLQVGMQVARATHLPQGTVIKGML